VTVTADPHAFGDQFGTITAYLQIQSQAAVNIPASVRVLVNNRAPEQRGIVTDIPGKLVDILADPTQDRIFVLRQDKNQIQVFDATTYRQIAVLRTANTPTQLAVTFDRRYLLVGHDDSQFAYVYDLDTLEPLLPIAFPTGHYPRSIASSGNANLSASRVAGPANTIDRISLTSRTASTLPTLVIFQNNINLNTVLAAPANGATILAAMADGLTVLGVEHRLYPDGLWIRGGDGFKGGTVDSRGDHRIAMSFAVGSLRAREEIEILDIANVATSFPGFVDIACAAGLCIETA